MVLDLTASPQLGSLNEISRENLSKIHDYALDYNIFLFKGIKECIDNNEISLIESIEALFESIPNEYSKLIHNPLGGSKTFKDPSTTSKLQNRLLELLIQERHYRDIENLNKQFDDKIQYIKLDDPSVYEIKSIFFKTFQDSKDEFKDQFRKFALLQSLEYDFEHNLDNDSEYQNDNDIIDQFCDETLLNFKLENTKNDETIVNESEIARVILPLASQVILGEDEEEDDEYDEEEEVEVEEEGEDEAEE